MNKSSQIDSYQVEQLLKRIEQLEAKLGIKVGSGGAESGKESTKFLCFAKGSSTHFRSERVAGPCSSNTVNREEVG